MSRPWYALALAALALLAVTGCRSDGDDEAAAQPTAWAIELPDEPAQVMLIEPNITVDVATDGYLPESDLLIGMSDDEQNPQLYLISPEGEVTRTWEVINRYGATIGDRRVLPNGNIMFVIWYDGAYEMTPEGEVVWAYRSEHVTHHAEALPDGTVLLVGADCNCVWQIDYQTQEEVWYWDAHQALPNYDDDAVFLGGEARGTRSAYASHYIEGESWSHTNHAQTLDNGNVLVSLRNFDLVMEVDREGAAVWSFGPGIVKHQHTPRDLGDGTMLIFDNGNHRTLRVDRATQQIIWAYDDIFSPILGDVNLLHDGNYKVVDSMRHTVKVVSPDNNEVLWSATIDGEEIGIGIYRAHFPDLEN